MKYNAPWSENSTDPDAPTNDRPAILSGQLVANGERRTYFWEDGSAPLDDDFPITATNTLTVGKCR